MKKIFFVSVLLISLLNLTKAQWQLTSLPDSIGVSSFVIKGDTIFAGSNYGVYFTSNKGNSWEKAGLDTDFITSMAVIGNNIYAGVGNFDTGNGGVYISSNNGKNWSATEYTGEYVNRLAVKGENINIVSKMVVK